MTTRAKTHLELVATKREMTVADLIRQYIDEGLDFDRKLLPGATTTEEGTPRDH